jgi:Ner family transcriptional regulator
LDWLTGRHKLTKSALSKSASKNWHPADIKAALAKRGYSLTRIAVENGYTVTSPSQVFIKPWPAMEEIMANIIGFPPQSIWPSRYDKSGNPSRRNRVAKLRRVRNV